MEYSKAENKFYTYGTNMQLQEEDNQKICND